jgi:hypothetical protein
MKLAKTAIASLLLAGSVYANDALVISMSKMENGLSNIQKGFLYNQKALIENGVKEIKEANKIFAKKDATKEYLPKTKQHFAHIAYDAANQMNNASDQMLKYLKDNEMSAAQLSYSKVINACGNCHALVRGW